LRIGWDLDCVAAQQEKEVRDQGGDNLYRQAMGLKRAKKAGEQADNSRNGDKKPEMGRNAPGKDLVSLRPENHETGVCGRGWS